MTAALRDATAASACQLPSISGIVPPMGERQPQLPTGSPENGRTPRLRLVSPERIVEIDLDDRSSGRSPSAVDTPTLDRAQAAAMLPQARAMLAALHADRTMIDARLGSLGRTDPIRAVTGRSALDAAVAEASELVAALEAICSAD
jgi:hypothetical protein